MDDEVKRGGVPLGHMDLRLAVLSRGPRLYSTRRLVEEARERGLDVDIIDPLTCAMFVDQGRVEVLVDGEPFEHEAVIPRIGHSITGHGTALLRHLDQLGVWSSNSAAGILQSRDKLRASQILARNRIPIPRTMNVRDVRDVDHAIEAVGGLPVVVKVTKGTQGQGVFLRHTAYEAKSLVQGLLHARRDVLIQEYVAESHGQDVRVIVVGDEVVAAMRRRARGREFRSNFHLNGTVESVDLPKEFADVARRAARVLGLNVAGVDLLEGNDGPMVLEVNSSPGLQGIEMASGVNVAGAIVDHAMREAGYGDVEIDGLLRMLPDEGVVTLQVRRHPALIGRSLSDVFHGEIETFAIARNSHMIWNPGPDTHLRFDDLILCAGPRNSLRNSIRAAVEGCADSANDNGAEPGPDEAAV
ncbi:MAG: 30S ribosomal protein S6--L-glutamate ligase [Euryarchaeota archaeon]|nr:30S ribosomal protein S6--L-glutamate ligase [Euryarchaeota archaeon]